MESFAQIKSGVVADKSLPVAPPDVNNIDVNQLFADFNFGGCAFASNAFGERRGLDDLRDKPKPKRSR